MPEAHGYSLDITAVGKEHRCACVAQTVEFQVPDVVPFEKFGELLGRSHRIHHVSIFLREDISEILPCVAEEGSVAFLMDFIFPQGIAQAVRNRNRADPAL